MNTTQNSTKSKIVKVIGVDLAKDHCDVIGYDENGKIWHFVKLRADVLL